MRLYNPMTLLLASADDIPPGVRQLSQYDRGRGDQPGFVADGVSLAIAEMLRRHHLLQPGNYFFP